MLRGRPLQRPEKLKEAQGGVNGVFRPENRPRPGHSGRGGYPPSAFLFPTPFFRHL